MRRVFPGGWTLISMPHPKISDRSSSSSAACPPPKRSWKVSWIRFARYMRSMADKTQFIVITHRRGTMEEADVLYGVTMQEKGVSKMLAINLNDVAAELDIK